MGTTLVGSPDTIAAGIQHLLDISQGGFGGMLFRANEWATREQIMRSYELFARYVMPRFQGLNAGREDSMKWAASNRPVFMGAVGNAINAEIQKHVADVQKKAGSS